MKYNIFNIDGKVIKKDDTILIKEKKVSSVIVQSVTLYNGKHTSRYSFNDNDSIYFFADGKGVIELENDILYHVSRNDVIFVNKGNSHKIINTGDIHLRYIIFKETGNYDRRC